MCQFFRPSGYLRVLLFFALDGGQCLFQSVFRRGFEYAFALFVEIHRCGVKGNQSGGQFVLAWGMAEIIGGDALGGEFVFAAKFPQQVGVDLCGFGLGVFEESVHRLGEFHENVVGFDFGTFAVLGGGLIGAIVFLHHGGHFELAAFFVEYIHLKGKTALFGWNIEMADFSIETAGF